jgi:hypothetical protein
VGETIRYPLGQGLLESEVSTIEATAAMAKAKGRPKTSEREDVSIKFDKSLAAMARLVATARGISIAEYLSELARPLIEKDLATEMKRLEGGKRE